MFVGNSELEKILLEENARLKGERDFFAALLQEVGQHLIDLDGEEWFCLCCGERAPISADSTDQKNYPHKATCALYIKK